MSQESLIKAIKKRREAAEISQSNAAEMIGVSLKTYQRIENGQTDIKMTHYRRLLKMLNLTELDLCLDMVGIEGATPWDVAAAARTLPPDVRTVLVTLIMMLERHRSE
ncbi:helix-turn-helix domain-containing protein [Vibrio fluvialis]|uniref:helix-turn-helix domain-containing protein n=1 Tax=Vibrio fluvialis TaxID=676 RepID=UPI0023A96F69|nr:helix-turn-helix transcriptional regulator [Vibrio fluvialis]MDE5179903.1 helix-turn-helix transcriptional regulator [Vibrio fluvialis]